LPYCNTINSRNSADVQWPTILTGISFNPVFYWAVNQTIVQRASGARIWISLILVAARFSNGNFRL